MRKVYFLIILICLSMVNNRLLAQCAVSISTDLNTTQLNCTVKGLMLTANTTAPGPYNYLWSTGEITSSIRVTDSTTYTVTIDDNNGCKTSSSISITQNITAPINTLLAFPDTICRRGASTLVALGAVTYLWQRDQQTGPVITVSPDTTTAYTVIGTAANTCSDTSTIRIVVHELPAASIIGTTTVCQNSLQPPVTFTGLSGTAPFTFYYTVNDGPSQSITTTGKNNSVMVGAPTGASGTLIYTLISVTDSNGCSQIQSGKDTVTVTAGISLTSEKTASVCNNAAFNYMAQSSAGSTTTFTWKRPAVYGISNTADSGTTAKINDTLKNTTSQPITVAYVFTLSAGMSCVTTDSVRVTVNPTPVIIPINDRIFCNGSPVEGIQFFSTSADAAITWTNSNTAIGLPAGGDGSISRFEANNSADSSITALITVSASINTCAGRSANFIVTILPAPILTSLKAYSICNSTRFTYLAKSSALGTKFFWTRPYVDGISNPSDSATTSNINETLINTTDRPIIVTYLFSLSTGSSCVTKDSVHVTVNPPLKITLAKAPSMCDNTSFTYTATTVAVGADFKWKRPAVAGISNKADSAATATINETLNNITAQPVVVTYLFTLSKIGCTTTDSLKITVNPNPHVDTITNKEYCNGYFVDGGIPFFSNPRNASFTWTNSNDSIGLPAGGIGTIPSFVAKNTTNKAKKDTINVSIMKDSTSSCPTAGTSFTITVLPATTMISSKTESVCDSTLFTYIAKASAPGTTWSWKRSATAGISNEPHSGNDSIISEVLHNTTAQPVIVKYTFNLSTGDSSSCHTTEILEVTVNPSPVIHPIHDTTFCNGNFVNPIKFFSDTKNVTFTWKSDTTVGFGFVGKDSIPAFTATNLDTIPIVALIKVSVTVGSNPCRGLDSNFSFRITVNPSPPKPNFTSLFRYPDNDTLKLCAGSQNINFNVNFPVKKIAYSWTTTANKAVVNIRDGIHANTVISFDSSGTNTVKLTATDTTNHCSSTLSQIVKVDPNTSITDKQTIFLKQPGNLLIYPDNSLAGFQWGYDSVLSRGPVASYGPSIPIQGQVYQFFIPNALFINRNNLLNDTSYTYWVLLQKNKDCYTKVYYNGTYSRRVMETAQPESTVSLQIFPNPNSGSFEIALKGNIYGSINAQIYNATGQVVFRKNFVKTAPAVMERLNTDHLPAGPYFLTLYSSDLKKVSSRFVIQR